MQATRKARLATFTAKSTLLRRASLLNWAGCSPLEARSSIRSMYPPRVHNLLSVPGGSWPTYTILRSFRGCFRSLRIDLYYAHYAQTLSQRSHRRTVGCSRSPAPTSQTWRTPSRSRPSGGGQRHPVRASERMRLAYAPQRSSSLANSVQILSEMDNGRNVETGQWDSALRRSRGGGQESDAQRGDHRQPVSEDY